MIMSERKRYWIVMIISLALNMGLKQVTYYCDMPFFLECTGTVLAAVILEPAAGLLAGLAENFMLAVIWNGPTSILYFTISASYALLFGNLLVRQHKILWKRMPLTMLLTFAGVVVSDAVISFLMDGSQLARWEGAYQAIGLKAGMPEAAAYLFGIGAIQGFDVLATAAVFILLYYLLPRSLTKRGTV